MMSPLIAFFILAAIAIVPAFVGAWLYCRRQSGGNMK